MVEIQEKQVVSRFINTLDPKEIGKGTKPSIILTGGTEEIGLDKLSPERIEQFLYMHPMIPRGIEKKANVMTGRGYKISPLSESANAKQAAEEMKKLLENSGGVLLLNRWIRDAYGFGNGYLTLVPNKQGNKYVRVNQEHPIFFRIARHKPSNDVKMLRTTQSSFAPEFNGPLKIDPNTKKPTSYTQVIYSDTKSYLIPYGKELPAEQVAHLAFDTWGDEVEGISILQYIFLDIKHLINMEEAGAEAIYRSGFTQKKILTDISTEKELRKMARNLQEINAKDAIILPKGTDVSNLFPGQTQFKEFHDVFLTLLAIRLGIPKPIITLDGTDINKATMDELVKDMMFDLKAAELKVKQVVEDQIFVSACQKMFGKEFREYPVFEFLPHVETLNDKINRRNVVAQSVYQMSQSMKNFSELGKDELVLLVGEEIKALLRNDLESDSGINKTE